MSQHPTGMSKEKKPKQASPVFHFMVRWTCDHSTVNKEILHAFLKDNADHYVFQAEDSGDNEHYQGYFHTVTKQRPKALAIAQNDTMGGIEIQAASTAGQKALKTYSMKEATRVAGPWSDKPIYMGKDLWPYARMPEWQKKMLDILEKEPDDRTMYWVYDPIGNKGKTKFAKYLCYKQDAVLLQYAHSGDCLNLVFKMQGKKIYVWNLTRSKPAQLSEQDLYSAMESIKDGLFFNSKYEVGMVMMNCPHILVFSNHLPKTEHISADRWKIFTFDEQDNLVDVDATLQNAGPPPDSRYPPVQSSGARPRPEPTVPDSHISMDGYFPKKNPKRSKPQSVKKHPKRGKAVHQDVATWEEQHAEEMLMANQLEEEYSKGCPYLDLECTEEVDFWNYE